MIRITVKRQIYNEKCVQGIFKAENEVGESVEGYTLEPPDKGNQTNISCILPGKYRAKKDASWRFGDVIRLEDKNGRTNILIHQGNYPRDTKGCILIGRGRAQNAVWSSNKKKKELINFVGGEDIEVIVKG